MPGSRGRGRIADRVHTEREVAYLLGASCFHPELTLHEVRQSVEDWGVGRMTDEEVHAYRSLTPGAFWSAFSRGWEETRARSERG